MLDLASALGSAGLSPHRFNFPYRAEGRGFPDRMPVLTESFRAAAQRVVDEVKPDYLILAGHSMGTRAALALAAEGFPCRGLILFSYPLHPPGHPEKLRLDHLDALKVPLLTLSGTSDAFCSPKLMDAAVEKQAKLAAEKAAKKATKRDAKMAAEQAAKQTAKIPSGRKWMHHWIAGADHGLRVAKKSGRTRSDVLAEVEAVCRDWLAGLPKP